MATRIAGPSYGEPCPRRRCRERIAAPGSHSWRGRRSRRWRSPGRDDTVSLFHSPGGPVMTTLARATTIGCALFAGVALAPMCRAQTPPVAEQIAKTYGVESFKTIDAIRFTFNAELGDLQLSRSWVWQPKTGQVSYAGKDKEGKPVTAT